MKYDMGSVSDFKLFGFATGNYACKCLTCGKEFIGDKRAYDCLSCVITKCELLYKEQISTGFKWPMKE